VPLYYAGLRVRNLERSVRFYSRVMGLKVEGRGDGREWGAGLWVSLRDPRSGGGLELNWYPKGSKWATPFEPGEALDHLGFFLGHVPRAHLEREYRRIIAGGARPTKITPEYSEGWTFYVTDPDGNWVEVFRRPTAAEQRAKVGEPVVAGQRKKGARRRKSSA
jgi:catechol 2,3-dioxygenase-like lactoylglutathione lyase family enzyme